MLCDMFVFLRSVIMGAKVSNVSENLCATFTFMCLSFAQFFKKNAKEIRYNWKQNHTCFCIKPHFLILFFRVPEKHVHWTNFHVFLLFMFFFFTFSGCHCVGKCFLVSASCLFRFLLSAVCFSVFPAVRTEKKSVKGLLLVVSLQKS